MFEGIVSESEELKAVGERNRKVLEEANRQAAVSVTTASAPHPLDLSRLTELHQRMSDNLQ